VNLKIILNEEEAEALDAILSREDGTWTPERARQRRLIRDRFNAAVAYRAQLKMFKRCGNGGRHV
jgi:hypothetical protein